MAFGLTADGFVAKTVEDIEAGFVARQRGDIDASIDTSQYELVGQLNAIMADALAELWELGEAVNDAFDPDKAFGAQQDALYALTNTLREGESHSRVVVTATLSAGANIAIGAAQISVVGNPNAKFTNAVALVNPGGSSAPFPALFTAVAAGPVAANAGTLTNIDSAVVGLESVTNAADAELGSNIESDPLYRLRRIDEFASQGGGTVPGIAADLRQLSTVRAASVVENETDGVVGGLPPHSIMAVVRSAVGASDNEAIARSIWSNKSGGVQTVGDISVSFTDDEGNARTIRFSRPAEISVYIALKLTTNPATYLGDTPTKTAIVNTLEDPTNAAYLDVGVDVFAGRIVAIALLQPGVINADARVSTATISNFNTAPNAVVIDVKQIAIVDTSRVTIDPL